jgi:hypothetical protein
MAFSSHQVLFSIPLPDGWEKGFFTTFNLDARDERGLGKLKGLPQVQDLLNHWSFSKIENF